jgi:hypothetical protein
MALEVAAPSCTFDIPGLQIAEGGFASEGEPVAVDAGDGLAISDGSDGEALVNLVQNPSFELGSDGCGTGWTAQGATMQRGASPYVRTGAASCILCASPPNTDFMNLSPVASIDVDAGTYSGEAWLLAPPPSIGGVSGPTGLQIFFFPPDGGPSSPYIGSMLLPDKTWTASYKSFVLSEPGRLEIMVHSYYPQGGCVVVDDVALYAE